METWRTQDAEPAPDSIRGRTRAAAGNNRRPLFAPEIGRTHFRFREKWATLRRYIKVYNQHIPQKALGHVSPIRAMKNRFKKRRELLESTYTIAGDLTLARLIDQLSSAVVAICPERSVPRSNPGMLKP